jgi:hypothetical protein
MAKVADRSLSWSVASWGPAACAAMVAAGSVAPWLTSGGFGVSGIRGDGAITLVLGLLALAAAFARASGFEGGSAFDRSLLVCLGAAALLGGMHWSYSRPFAAEAVGLSYTPFEPGPGMMVVILASFLGAAWITAGLAHHRRAGSTVSAPPTEVAVSTLALWWAGACVCLSALVFLATRVASSPETRAVATAPFDLVMVAVVVAFGLTVVLRLQAWPRRQALFVACVGLVDLAGWRYWRWSADLRSCFESDGFRIEPPPYCATAPVTLMMPVVLVALGPTAGVVARRVIARRTPTRRPIET